MQGLAVVGTSRLASASYDKSVRVWAPDGRCVASLRGHTAPVCSVAALPDGVRLLSGSLDKTARLWDVEADKHAGGLLVVLKGHTDAVRCVGTLPDGRLWTGSDDASLRLWVRLPHSPLSPEHPNCV